MSSSSVVSRLSPGKRVALGAALAATLASTTFGPVIFAVLATSLRTEFSLSRWQLGALVMVVNLTGAVLSTSAGALADRIPPRKSTALTQIIAATAFLAMALAPSYWVLAATATIAGLAQAMGNPSTNRLIMSRVEAGRRGLLTGLKQAGVQAGSFIGGILLPLGAASFLGWRGAVSLAVVLPLSGLVALGIATRGSSSEPKAPPMTKTSAMTPAIIRLTLYASLLGLGTGGLLTYISSYAQEAFGLSEAAGGALVAGYAVVGIVARLSAGHVSERYLGHNRTLALMALITALAGALTAAAPSAVWLWPAALLIGLGPMAWNVVANVAVMEMSPTGTAGRGSGIVMAGFLGGMAVGTPLLGASADLMDSYRPGWWVVAVLGLIGTYVGYGVRPAD